MKRKIRRLFALCAVFALLAGLLAGCGGKTDGKNAAAERPEFVYVPSYTELMGGGFEYINSNAISAFNGSIYFASYKYSSVDPEGNVLTEEDADYWTYYTGVPGIYTMDLDGSAIELLPAYEPMEIPEGSMGSSNIDALCVDAQGGIWVCESMYAYHYDAPEGMTQEDEEYWNYYVDDGSTYAVRKLDAEGKEISRLSLDSVSGDSDYFYVYGFATDSQGNIYISSGENIVYILDDEGNKLFTLEVTNWVDRILTLADGSVGVMSYEESGQVIKQVDFAAKAWGATYAMPSNAWNLYAGGGDYLFFSGSDTVLYGYNTITGENEKILNWLDSDIDSSSLDFVLPLEDGRIAAMSSEWDSNYQNRTNHLITLVKTPSSELPEKTILTYACVYLDWNVRTEILKFNKSNDKYRIEVRDYSEYNTEEDYDAGFTKLTTEIISGNVPDMLSTSSLPIDKYAAKGLLEDLYTFMDADPELGRDKFVPSVLKALETSDGKLYQMSSSFSVMTVMGDADVVGSEPGWTMKDLQAIMAEMPERTELFSLGTTQADMLRTACTFGMDDFIDWKTGECSFDSGEFAELLEFCASFPKEFDWDNYEWTEEDDDASRIMAGKQLLMNTSMYDFQYFQMYNAMFNNNVSFKGFPCESGSGNALSLNTGIAITSSCSDKQGAWEFVKVLLSEEYQSENVWNFPTNQAAFDAMLEEAMTPVYETDPETGEQVEQSQGGWGWGSLMIEIYALKQEDADRVVELINSIDRVYSYDSDIMDIITEESAAFFNGEKSAQDTAQLIQSRVNIYVNEQR